MSKRRGWRATTPALLLLVGCVPSISRPLPTPVLPAETAPFAMVRSEHLRHGPAHCDGRLLDRIVYLACHHRSWRMPQWVAYRLRAADLLDIAPRRDRFRADPDLPTEERAELSDYRGSGFSRGHLAPADDFRRDAIAMDATFLLSNMAPQLQGMNGGRWRILEAEVQDLARRHGRTVIVTGPLFLGDSLTPADPSAFLPGGRVPVPTHFFKIVFCHHEPDPPEVFAFVFEHRNGLPGPTARYAVSVDQLEAASGLDFLTHTDPRLEVVLEASLPGQWPVP